MISIKSESWPIFLVDDINLFVGKNVLFPSRIIVFSESSSCHESMHDRSDVACHQQFRFCCTYAA